MLKLYFHFASSYKISSKYFFSLEHSTLSTIPLLSLFDFFLFTQHLKFSLPLFFSTFFSLSAPKQPLLIPQPFLLLTSRLSLNLTTMKKHVESELFKLGLLTTVCWRRVWPRWSRLLACSFLQPKRLSRPAQWFKGCPTGL